MQSNLQCEIRGLLTSGKRVESFNDLSDVQKKSLAIEALTDTENFDPADILLYRDDTLKIVLTKFLNGTMKSDQCMEKILNVLVKGVKKTMEELIDDQRSELLSE
jgi:hypothetical protein